MRLFGFRVSRSSRGRLGLTAPLVVAIAAVQILSPTIGSAQQRAKAPAASGVSSGQSALLDQAKKLVQDGDPQSALSVLQQADPHGANASDIHAMKGICLALLSKPIESAAEFEQAICVAPKVCSVLLYRRAWHTRVLTIWIELSNVCRSPSNLIRACLESVTTTRSCWRELESTLSQRKR